MPLIKQPPSSASLPRYFNTDHIAEIEVREGASGTFRYIVKVELTNGRVLIWTETDQEQTQQRLRTLGVEDYRFDEPGFNLNDHLKPGA